MDVPVLEMQSISMAHRKTLFLDLSLAIHAGEFVTLMGENGAGKTTLIQGLLGVQPFLKGEVRFFGKTLGQYSREELHQRVSWVLSDTEEFPPSLTVRELLHAVSRLYRTWDHQMEADLIRAFHLPGDAQVNHLSLGERAKLKLVRAVSPQPRLLICDELTANLSPQSKKQITDTLIDLLASSKMSLLYSCHLPDEAIRLSDRIYTLTEAGLREGPVP